ncbi:MAG: adenosylcobinamide-phosphate synthase CbiB [Lachnospirales bacterium]
MIGIILGFILDFIFGDPYFLPHPIRWMGRLISFLENKARKLSKNSLHLKISGFIIVIIVIFIVALVSFSLLFICYKINIYLAILVNAIMCYYALAMRSLKKESMKVYFALKKGDINLSRKAVSMIVGRDTQNLDDVAVTKAAVETVAENLSDGVIAPLFYMLIGLGPLAMVYKAINTMDSMLGYKDEKYRDIGYACAKLDDIVNFIPSRLGAIFMIIVSGNIKNSYRIWKRDRFNHKSPNSAQTESVCAGALGVMLAGDATYFGKLYKKPTIGDNLRNIEYEDIIRANNLMMRASFLFLIFGLIVKGLILWLL